jgi:hypothetical protein
MFIPVNNFEFRGAGINIDRHNFYLVNPGSGFSTNLNLHQLDGHQLQTGSLLFNGCTITNSVATQVTYYWNGGQPPQLQIQGYNGYEVCSWVVGCTLSYMQGICIPFTFQAFNRVNAGFSSAHGEPQFIYGEYYANAPISTENVYNLPRNSFSVTYNGAGTNPTAAYDGAVTFTLSVNGATVKSFTLNSALVALGDGTTTFSRPSQIVNYINTNLGPDWSATLIDTNDFSAYQMNGHGNTFSQVLTVGSPYTITTYAAQHSEWIHWQGTSGVTENVIVWNCTVTACGWGTSFIDQENHGLGFNDFSLKNITYDPQPPDAGNSSTGTYMFGSHCVYENWTVHDTVQVAGSASDGYSAVSEIVCVNMVPNGGSYTGLVPTNCVVGGANAPTGNGCVNPFTAGTGWTDAQWASLFTSRTSGNWAPSATLSAYTFPPATPRDAAGNIRAANDAAGAWALNAPAVSWPF